jgi:biotin carboxylase
MKHPFSEPLRLLILASKLGYQTRGFAAAGAALGAQVIFGTDRCEQLDDPWRDGAIALHFERAEEAARAIVDALEGRPAGGIVAVGDRPTVAAAYAARSLGLAHHSPEAVRNCRSKLRQREILRGAGLPVPEFFSFRFAEDFNAVLKRVRFPCVLKPLVLAASQGVIRANTPEEFLVAAWRIRALLESPEVQATREAGLDRLLVESYVPGAEFALEGLLTNRELRALALFDKPDPLEGPYFEETVYVTPSRLPAAQQASIMETARRAVRALGLTHGPVHAEFRWNDAGPWVIEIAPRPIGGLCSRALRFGAEKILLEDLLVRHALGFPVAQFERETEASGVMMIPVPQSGILEDVAGLEEAQAVPGVTEIQITARLRDFIAAWPEGSSYLGFIFARGENPGGVEAALRLAHSKLRFDLRPRLPVEHPGKRRPNQPFALGGT